MPTEKAKQSVKEVSDLFASSSIIVAAQYRGLNVSEMGEFRASLREKNCNFKIVKNTYARLAADQSGKPELKEFMDGPIGFLTSSTDPALAAKALVNHTDKNSLPMVIIGGWLDGDILDEKTIKRLAKLPSKDELILKMVTSINSPIYGLVNVMEGPIRGLTTVLKRYVNNNLDNKE